ncbi:hypothetical protein [Dethiothermospora halolimnae]|uniref:hypothetical protein n=1 Tax=Dethiothermospora halolimnae TaxID=3114390 RepID=UPI003CCC0F4A
MKDFAEFLKLIDEEYHQQLADSINDLKLSIKLPLDKDNVDNLINSIAVISHVSSINLLRKYHEWLNSHE